MHSQLGRGCTMARVERADASAVCLLCLGTVTGLTTLSAAEQVSVYGRPIEVNELNKLAFVMISVGLYLLEPCWSC